MKSLCLLRHAQAVPETGAGDFERGLSPAGLRACAEVSPRLAACFAAPERLLCSSSRRTRETLPSFQAVWGLLPERVVFEDDLYLAPVRRLRARVAALPDAVSRVLILGHNPGLSELLFELAGTGELSGSLPTCGAAVLEAASWEEMADGNARLLCTVLAGERDV